MKEVGGGKKYIADQDQQRIHWKKQQKKQKQDDNKTRKNQGWTREEKGMICQNMEAKHAQRALNPEVG